MAVASLAYEVLALLTVGTLAAGGLADLLRNLVALLACVALAFRYWNLGAEFGWSSSVTYFLVNNDSTIYVLIVTCLAGWQIHAVLSCCSCLFTVHCVKLDIFTVSHRFHNNFWDGVVIAFILHTIITNFSVHWDGLGVIDSSALSPSGLDGIALLPVGGGLLHCGVGGKRNSLWNLLANLFLVHLAALLTTSLALSGRLETLRHLHLLAIASSIGTNILLLVVMGGADISIVLAACHSAILGSLGAPGPVHGVAPLCVLGSVGCLWYLSSSSRNRNGPTFLFWDWNVIAFLFRNLDCFAVGDILNGTCLDWMTFSHFAFSSFFKFLFIPCERFGDSFPLWLASSYFIIKTLSLHFWSTYFARYGRVLSFFSCPAVWQHLSVTELLSPPCTEWLVHSLALGFVVRVAFLSPKATLLLGCPTALVHHAALVGATLHDTALHGASGHGAT